MSGPLIDRTGVRYTPALGAAPACEHPGLPCLRLVVTDLHHPAVPAVAAALRRSCPGAYLVGASADDPLPPPPPGIDAVIDQRPGPFMDALETVDGHGCDTLLPLSPADVWEVACLHDNYVVPNLRFVYPTRSLYSQRSFLLQRLRTGGVPVVPAVCIYDSDGLREAAAELGYPGTDLTVVLDDVFYDSGPWTVTARPDLTAPGRQVPLAAMAAIFDQRRKPDDVDRMIVRPAAPQPDIGIGVGIRIGGTQPGAYITDPGLCTVDLVAEHGTILAVLARQPATAFTGGAVDTTITLPAAARTVITATAAHLQWTGPATITLTGLPDTPTVIDVLPWLDPAAHLGTHAGADIITTAVRHARGEHTTPAHPNWHPTQVTGRRYHLTQHWPHLP